MHKSIKVLLLIVAAFVTHCSGFILTSREFLSSKKTDVIQTDQNETIINICSDFHWVGTKIQNLLQLKYFIEEVLTQNSMHLIIESQFFYEINYSQIGAARALELFNNEFSKFNEISSFDCSPQDIKQTTWIAWELPLVLLAIHHDEALPAFIRLTKDQREFIKNNVSCEFCDPRMLIKSAPSQLETAKCENYVTEKCKNTLNISPVKNKNMVLSYVEDRLNNASKEPTDHSFCAEYFDVEVITSIVNHLTRLNKGLSTTKKIVILCGNWHTLKLRKGIATLGFFPRSKAEVNASGDHITDNLAKSASENMLKIISGELRDKSRRVNSPEKLSPKKLSPNVSPKKKLLKPKPSVIKRLDFGENANDLQAAVFGADFNEAASEIPEWLNDF